MNENRMIEIDLNIHKIIEDNRQSFSETENEILCRILKIQAPAITQKNTPTGKAWMQKGVVLPHGTLLRAEYNGTVYSGIVENGVWIVEGKKFTSPSGAMRIAHTKIGTTPSLNGWIYWEVKRPIDTKWIAIKSLKR